MPYGSKNQGVAQCNTRQQTQTVCRAVASTCAHDGAYKRSDQHESHTRAKSSGYTTHSNHHSTSCDVPQAHATVSHNQPCSEVQQLSWPPCTPLLRCCAISADVRHCRSGGLKAASLLRCHITLAASKLAAGLCCSTSPSPPSSSCCCCSGLLLPAGSCCTAGCKPPA